MADRLYLFFGEEDFLIQERVEELKKHIANPSLNIEQIDGEEPDKEKIISIINYGLTHIELLRPEFYRGL